MSVLTKIQEDLKIAMKNGVVETTQTIRYILSEAQQIALKVKRKELTDDDIKDAVSKCLKEGNEGIEIYKNLEGKVANDNYLRNYRLVEICKLYMPVQLTLDEIKNLINQCISTVGATSVKEMGKVMGTFTSLVEKGTYDPKQVSRLIKEQLS